MIRFDRFKLILLLVATIFYNCNASDQSHYEMQQKSINDDNIGCNKLSDLNVDVLNLIFDQLDIDDMLNLLIAYPIEMFLAVARYSFWIRYKEFVVHIDYRSDGVRSENKSRRVEISIRDATKMLKYFGNSFEKLTLWDLFDPLSDIIKDVNKYARDSLIKLSIICSKPYILNFFTKPFGMLEELSFEYTRSETIEAGPLSLEQVFPKLQKLAVIFNRDIDLGFISRKFPLLEHFQFVYTYSTGDVEVSGFLKLNPQIKSIDATRLSQMLCDTINEYLPNLESLVVSRPVFEIEHDTSIPSVKHFQISVSYYNLNPESMINLSFPKLQSLQFDFPIATSSTWAEYLRKHSNISHLNILDVHNYWLVRLMDELPNLKEVTLQHSMAFADSVTPTTIGQIIERHQTLVKLQLMGFYLHRNELNNLREEFENDWSIVTVHCCSRVNLLFEQVNLLFEKKNQIDLLPPS